MKSFGEYFSSLLNMNMFFRTESSKDSLGKTQHDKEEVQETKSEKSEETKSEKSEETKSEKNEETKSEKNEESEENKETEEEEKNETFEFIEVAESSFDKEVEDMFITKF